MDFNDTPEEAAFRGEARAFLSANAKPKANTRPVNFRRHIGPDQVQAAKAWQKTKAEAGFAAITWPKQWGGRDASPMMQVIYNQEESNYAVPNGVYEVGLGMCIPTLMQYSPPEQLARFVPPAVRGEEIWCQLFSEPSGGSDLAALRTRAEKQGGEWVVNGQKIWNSGAHYADWGILVTRTDPNVPKHAGLTFFIVDMKTPGIEVRQITQMSGSRHFNEVFFTDVRIPDSQRIGGVGNGWRVALTTLMNERMSVAGVQYRPDMDDVVALARSLTVNGKPAIRDTAVREKIADWWTRSQGLRLTQFRTLTALSKGKDPGPENSIGKLVKASMTQDIASWGMDLMDAAGAVMDPDLAPQYGIFQDTLLGSPGGRIAGGSDEIMRNIIAERVLGMPQDIRADKGMSFNQIPTARN
jgi:alkylation response protein AidB-like acyl-CoA dehydrogenase